MSIDDGIQTLEIELAELTQEFTAPGWRECLLCFTNRMLVSYGCDNTLRWARRWREERAPRATALERRLSRQGVFCDCEIFANGWDVAVPTVTDPHTGESWWPEEVTGCRGVAHGSSQPCSLWTLRREPWG